MTLKVPVWDSASHVHSSMSNINFGIEGGVLQNYFLYTQLSIHGVEYAFTVIFVASKF